MPTQRAEVKHHLQSSARLIKACHFAANMSVAELARAYGVSERTIAQIVNSDGDWWHLEAFTLAGAIGAKLRAIESYWPQTEKWLMEEKA